MTISQQILLIGSLLTPFAPSTFAQQAAQTDPTQARPVVYSQLPEGNGVWVVHVTRTGGFAGIWMALTVTSEGKVDCPACTNQSISRTLSKRDLESATPSFNFPTIADTSTATMPESQLLVTFCSDCISTRIAIQRRDSAGKIETYSRSWNDVTASTAPPEFVKLVAAILSFAKK